MRTFSDAEALLGAYALRGLLLAVDTPNEQLVPVPGLLKQQERMMSACEV